MNRFRTCGLLLITVLAVLISAFGTNDPVLLAVFADGIRRNSAVSFQSWWRQASQLGQEDILLSSALFGLAQLVAAAGASGT